MHIIALVLLIVFCMPIQGRAIDCPKIPEQTNKNWDVAVKAAVGRIGPVKGAELETQTRKATIDLMGKLPQADKVYLEQMMYATYCSALRDDKTISESEKARRIRAYNLEVKKTLDTAKGKKESDKKKAPQNDGRIEARTKLAQLSLPFTPQAFIDNVKKGDTDVVKLYLAGGMDPDSVDDKTNTALMHAVGEGHRQIIDILLRARADVNKKNFFGGTAVSWATGRDKRDILRTLLEHGANKESITRALVDAASEGDVDLLKMLMAKGADIKAKWDGKPIADLTLERAIDHSYSVSEKDAVDTVEFLLDHGADINARFHGEYGERTALLLATHNGNEAMVRTLLKRGADPNAKFDCRDCLYDGFTPLMIAVWNVKINIVKALLDKGADINARCRGGDPPSGFYGGSTALMLAVIRGPDEMVEFLISRNADLKIKDNNGQSVLQVAVVGWRSSIKILRILIDKGLDVHDSDNEGNTMLMRTCGIEKVRLLLEKNCDVNVKNNVGKTALMQAIMCNHLDAVRALLDKGAEINVKNREGVTPLMIAAIYSRPEIVMCLLERGADVADKDPYGRTALDFTGKSILKSEEKEKLIRLLKMAKEKKK